jgi:hypothetical protein
MKTLPKLKWVDSPLLTSEQQVLSPTAPPEPAGYWADQGNRKERRRLAKVARQQRQRQ